MSRVALQLQLWLARAGWLPLLAGLSFVASAFVAQVAEPRVRQATRTAAAQHAALRREAAMPAPVDALRTDYVQFRTHLPTEDKQEEILKSLLAIAAETGISINQADYDRQSDADCDCIKLHISMPLKGSYPQVRAFIDHALGRIEALALESLSLHRESVKTPDVEAKLRFTLYLRATE